MYVERLIKASVVRLWEEEGFDKGMAADEPDASAATVVTYIKDRLPPELFNVPVGDGTFLPYSPPLSEFLSEMWRARSAIENRAAELGWVGNPTSSFTNSPADGYYQEFQNASIYWTERFGAKEVHGAIRDRYLQMGAELSYLGFPQTDELRYVRPDGGEVRYSNFQGGTIYWTADRGAFLNLSFDPITERYQTGAYLHMVGQGFTPNRRVSFWIVNAPHAPKSIGSIQAASDGRFGANSETRPVFLLWNRPGDHDEMSIARAVDEATGQAADHRLSYALH